MKTIVAFGEMLWDLLPEGAVLGGAPFNLAFRLQSLGERVYPVSRVGTDQLGDEALQRARELGMDTRYVQRDRVRPTGTVIVRLSPDPDFVINTDTAYDRIADSGELQEIAAEADAICFGTLIQRSPESRRTLDSVLAATRGLKFLDLNLRRGCYTPETVRSSLLRADVLKLNDAELAEMPHILGTPPLPTRDLARDLVERWDLSIAVVTRGADGAYAVSRNGTEVSVEGRQVALVDSIGCGDAFSAGFLHRHLRGAGLLEACRFGNDIGAVVATQRGATVPIPREELERIRAGRDGAAGS